MTSKKKLAIILTSVITVALAVIIALILWDPMNLLRLRIVAWPLGTYEVREADLQDDVDFNIETITVTQDGAISVVIDGEILTTDMAGINDNLYLFLFSYDEGEYSIFCWRKSDLFKLVGTTPCDYMQCYLHLRTDTGDITIGTFKAVRVAM